MQSGLYVGKSRSSAAPQTVVHLRYRWLPIGDNLWSPMTGTGLSASGICGTLGSQLRHLFPLLQASLGVGLRRLANPAGDRTSLGSTQLPKYARQDATTPTVFVQVQSQAEALVVIQVGKLGPVILVM